MRTRRTAAKEEQPEEEAVQPEPQEDPQSSSDDDEAPEEVSLATSKKVRMHGRWHMMQVPLPSPLRPSPHAQTHNCRPGHFAWQTAAALRGEQQAARQAAQAAAKERRRRQQAAAEEAAAQRREQQDAAEAEAGAERQPEGEAGEAELDLLPDDVLAAIAQQQPRWVVLVRSVAWCSGGVVPHECKQEHFATPYGLAACSAA